MKKIWAKLLSLFLCLVLLLNLLEPAAHAEGAGGGDPSSQELITEDPGESNLYDPEVEEILDDSDLVGSPEAIELDLENPYEGVFDQTAPEISDETILSEETDRREESVRHVRLSNGSLAALQYTYPIFEKNAQDEWVEIDNRLQTVKNEDGSESYHTDRQGFSVDFLKEPQTGQLLQIAFPEGELSWSLAVPAERTSSVNSTYTPLPDENETSLLNNKSVSGLLEYTNVLPYTRLRYQLTGYDIKEDLILDSPEAVTEEGVFRFVLDPGPFTIRQADEQTLEVLDPEESPRVSICAPMMRDAAGQISFGLQLTLEEAEENTTRRTVLLTADEEWLNAEERVYPVTIDPTVQVIYDGYNQLDTVTVWSASPNNHSEGFFAVGSSGAYGNMRTLVKARSLPTLKSSDAVIAASFSGTTCQYNYYGLSHRGSIYINLYAMSEEVALENITWNNTQNAYDETVIDRQEITGSEFENEQTLRLSWDITRLVKDWYNNESNHGFLLISENESDPSRIRNVEFYAEADHAGAPASVRPALTVTYLNQEGLEPYLSTHGSGSATMGSLQVGDFNGNLVYTYTDVSMDGAYMPVTLAHVFNFSRRTASAVVGGGAYFGKGMRLNLSMKVTDSSVSGYPYCLTDADGTIHYFSLKSGTLGAAGSVYEKEFESTTLLTKTGSGFTLDTGGTLIYYFNTDGFLKSIKDITNNKSQTLTYTDGLLTQVKDGANRTVTLAYNSSGYLTSVTDPAGRSTSYTYTDGQLTKITRPDNTHIDLEYSGTWLVKVRDIDGTSIGISYWSRSPYRVKRLQEYGADGSEGGRLIWTYTSGGTKVSDREGRSETMLFDNAGHTVCVRDGEGNAVFGKYSDTDDDCRNSLLYASGMQGSVTNYLKNHSFESSLSGTWSAYNSYTEGSFTSNTELPREGNKSLKITSTGTASSYGVYQSITVPDAPGKTLTFSAWVNLSNYVPDSTHGFHLNIRYQNASGDWVSNLSSIIPAADGWQRQSWTVKIPEDASSDNIRVVFQFYRQTGTCYVDKAQLETGAVSNRYNLLENGHFREGTGSTSVSGWTRVDLDSTDKTAEGRVGSGCSITGVSAKDKRLTQTVAIADGREGDNYVFSAWAKAEAVPAKDLLRNTYRDFAVRIVFIRSNGTTEEDLQRFEAKTADWQYLSGSVVAPCDYVSIRFELLYQKQKNTVIFDDACLYRERFGDLMTYDDEGRLETVTDQNGKVIRYTYVTDGRPEISQVKYPDGTTTNYTYDNTTRRLLTATDTSGKTVNYSYDSNGNAKEARTTIDGVSLSSGITTYTGSYVSSVKDPFGKTTAYSYDQNKGLLNTLTNAKSVATNYTYNIYNDYLTKVQTGSSKVTYTYDSGRLSTLTHNTATSTSGNVVYGLTYNTFGTRTGVSVGTQDLVTYTYKAHNGDLSKTTYGNGQTSQPGYDSLGRVTSMKYNGTTTYRYYYGTTGRVGLEEDVVAGTNRRFSYDQGGRLTAQASSDGETHKYSYNSKGELSGSSYVTPQSGTVKTVYTYGNYNDSGERLLKKLTIHSSRVVIDYDYDSFYRAGNTITLSSGATLATTYEFRPGSGTDTTSVMPESQTQVMKDMNGTQTDSLTTGYTYDALGNIRTVREGGYLKLKYYYDDLNQLIREDNKYLNKTITYSYDLGGNLTSVTEYTYQTGETISGTGTTVGSYTYGDSNWKDKLTSYNSHTITYDAIGNPLQYHNGYTFTWQRGRQLAAANNGTNSISYTYNSDGIRTAKTVNGTTTNYVLEGTKVVFESDGTDNIWYYYNASGAPVGFRMNTGNTNTLFVYRKNLQGDITGIYVGYTGEMMVSYKYDAWGKVTATNEAGSSLGMTLINRNPYLYRGYRYDRETGLYYLNSRYYDPETGRFINADGFISTGQGVLSSNIFMYCLNNASSRIDTDGRSASDTCCVEEADMGGWRYNYGGGYVYYPEMHITKYFGFGALLSNIFAPQPAEVDTVVEVSIDESKSTQNNSNDKKRTSANQMQKQIEKGQAPKDVDRADKGNRNIKGNKDHIHFKDGTVLNYDGTISHESRGIPQISNETAKWLNANRWETLIR
nr:hypothetical protein [Lachnospiraceae bacterium]